MLFLINQSLEKADDKEEILWIFLSGLDIFASKFFLLELFNSSPRL